eukprot:6184017-Pleurochrysis_carterae.AAC.1
MRPPMPTTGWSLLLLAAPTISIHRAGPLFPARSLHVQLTSTQQASISKSHCVPPICPPVTRTQSANTAQRAVRHTAPRMRIDQDVERWLTDNVGAVSLSRPLGGSGWASFKRCEFYSKQVAFPLTKIQPAYRKSRRMTAAHMMPMLHLGGCSFKRTV